MIDFCWLEGTPRRRIPLNRSRARNSSTSKAIMAPSTPQKADAARKRSSPSKDSAIGMSDEDEDKSGKGKSFHDSHEQLSPKDSAQDHPTVPESIHQLEDSGGM